MSIVDNLHQMAISAAPALNFRTSSPHVRNVEFSVQVGWTGGALYCPVERACRFQRYLHSRFAMAPYVFLKLSLTPAQGQDHRGEFPPTHRVMCRSIQTDFRCTRVARTRRRGGGHLARAPGRGAGRRIGLRRRRRRRRRRRASSARRRRRGTARADPQQLLHLSRTRTVRG